MSAIIYARHSTDKQGESSATRQPEVCREHAIKHDLRIVLEESEEVSSGVPFEKRPGGARVLVAL